MAWKPASSWMSTGNVEFSRQINFFEGSWVFRTNYLKEVPLDTHPSYIDHPVALQTLEAGLLATNELGGRTSYIYRWATGAQHLSGYGGSLSEEAQRTSVKSWRRHSNDVRLATLVPADLTLRWRQYLDGIKDLVTPEEWELNRKGLRW